MTPPPKDDLARHADALRRLARKLVGGRGPWEDLVQSTYLAALEHAPRSISLGWMAQVLRNRATDHHRRQGANPVEQQAPEALDRERASSDGAEILE